MVANESFGEGENHEGLRGVKAMRHKAFRGLAGEPGFEPGLTESESVGLPLTYSPRGDDGGGVDPFFAMRLSPPRELESSRNDRKILMNIMLLALG